MSVAAPVAAAARTRHGATQLAMTGLSYSQKRWFTLGLAEAKKPETRSRRIEKYVSMLSEGRAR